MTCIHVCPLSKVEAVLESSGARFVMSLLAPPACVPALPAIAPAQRLHLAFSDIVVATADRAMPEAFHIEALLTFVREWDRETPLLIHCYAGVSRSTAAAYIALCALDPETGEDVHAKNLRAASPTATPNPRFVALADAALGRGGRMVEAIAGIGRGADCYEGACFALPVPPPIARNQAL